MLLSDQVEDRGDEVGHLSAHFGFMTARVGLLSAKAESTSTTAGFVSAACLLRLATAKCPEIAGDSPYLEAEEMDIAAGSSGAPVCRLSGLIC